MASDFTITAKIKFTIENAGASGGSPSGTAGVSAAGGDIKGVSDAFKELAAEVKAAAESVKQLKNLITSVPKTPESGAIAPVTAGVSSSVESKEVEKVAEAIGNVGDAADDTTKKANELLEEITKLEAGAGEASKSLSEVTKATQEQAEAASEAAKSEESLAEAQERLKKAADDTIRSTQKVAAAEDALAKARAAADKLVGGPRKDERLSPRDFLEQAKGFIASRQVREGASSVGSAVSDLFRTDKNAGPNEIAAATKLKARLEEVFATAAKQISSGTASRRLGQEVAKQARDSIRDVEKEFGSAVANFNVSAGVQRVVQAQLTHLGDAASAAFEGLVDAIDKGNTPERIAELASQMRSSLESFRRVFELEGGGPRSQLEPFDREGKKRSVIETPLAGEIRIERNGGLELSAVSQKAFDIIKQGAEELVDPATSVRRAFHALAQDMANFLPNFAALSEVLKDRLNRRDFETDDQFLNKRQQQTLLGAPKFTAGGLLRNPGVQNPEESRLFAAANIAAAKANLLNPALGGGKGAKSQINIPVTDAVRGVRQLKVTLEALGPTLDKVKVKARDVSDNMFDRASVTTALQRVAVWGSAAGIVFGTLNALAKGARTVIDTESSIVALSKVMNEAAVDFESFEKKARDAAVTIAKEFGQPLNDVLQTMIEFGQQGLRFPEVKSLTRASALAANVTTLNQPQAASALTAASAQFGLDVKDAERIVDSFNEVSNNAAVTETDLAEAIKRAGLAAKAAGVSFDEFNGLVAAIAEQTRQSGSEIGTALRFIFSRLQTPEAEKGLARVGISVRDAEGNIRNFIPVIQELSEKFPSLSESAKTSVAIALSETRRFNTLLALFNNFSGFQKSAADSANSTGSALREQGRQAETAGFKIEQLKNSLNELALTFGDAALPTFKVVIDTLSGFTDVLSALPSGFKTVSLAVAISAAAFARFSDRILEVVDGLTSFTALGNSVKSSVGSGVNLQVQAAQSTAKFVERQANAPQILAGRTVGDLAGIGGAASGLASAFSKDTGIAGVSLRLKTAKGDIVSAANEFTKFDAVVRGFKVDRLNDAGEAIQTMNLGVATLNNSFLKVGAVIAKVFSLPTRLPGVNAIFNGIDKGLTRVLKIFPGVNTALASTLSSIGRAAAGFYLFTLAIEGVSKAIDILTASGAKTKTALRSEIAEREEAIAQIERERGELKSLADERARAAAIRPPTNPALLEDQILRGNFKSPRLAEQRFNSRSQEAANAVAISNPQLVESIDSLGNVTLRGADAFEALANSAGSAQKELLALSRIKVIEGFAKDLKTNEGTFRGFVADLADDLQKIPLLGRAFDFIIPDDFAKSAGAKLKQSLEEFRKALSNPAVKTAQKTGVDIGLLSDSAAEKLREAGANFAEASDNIKVIVSSIEQEISKIPSDAGPEVFRRLGRGETATVLDRNVDVLGAEGVQTNRQSLINQLFLKNRSSLKGFGASIGVNAQQTVDLFNERGVQEQVLELGSNVRDAIKNLNTGDLVFFPNIEGFTQQAVVEVAEDGRKSIKFIADEFGATAKTDLEEAINKNKITQLQVIDIQRVKQAIQNQVLELGRVAAGAGRGALSNQDLDLGANFKFELSGQQRASRRDEALFANLLSAQKDLQDVISASSSDTQDENQAVKQSINPEVVIRVRELAKEFDKLAVITKFRAELENVGAAFEKAANDIENSKIGDRIEAQFSGVLGIGAPTPRQRFETFGLPNQLTGKQSFANRSPDLILSANALSDSQKALGEFVKGTLVADRTITQLTNDFKGFFLPGAAGDISRPSGLLSSTAALEQGGVDRANALIASLAGEQLKTQDQMLNTLKQILDANTNPKFLGSALAQATTDFSKSSDVSQQQAIERISAVGEKSLDQFTKADLERIFSNLGSKTPENVSSELFSRRLEEVRSDINTQLTTFSANNKDSTKKESDNLFNNPEFRRRAAEEEAARKNMGNFLKETNLFSPESIQQANLANQKRANDQLFESINSAIDVKSIGAKLSSGQQVDFGATASKAIEQGIAQLKPVLGDRVNFNDKALDALKNIVENQLKRVFTPPAPSAQRERTVDKRDLDEERRTSQAINRATREAATALDAMQKPIMETIGIIKDFGDAASQAVLDLQSTFSKAISDIETKNVLQKFTTPQTGPLAGISVPGVDLDTRGKSISELTGTELTSKENPFLSKNLINADQVFKSTVDGLTQINEQAAEFRRSRAVFERQGNLRGVETANAALAQLGNISNLVESQASSAQRGLREFADSFSDLKVINDVRVDVEKLVQSLRRQQELASFDNTSIETALGKTPFSGTRPTFEQFQQGQAGNLTKFERTKLDIEARQRSGQINPQEAQTENARNEFTRNEEIIAFAQQRETQKFQNEISTAQQVASRLQELRDRGGAGSQEAGALFEQLRSELETAGDLSRTSGGDQIRDPRTGQLVNIPAGQTLEFQGTPSLEGISGELGKIASAQADEQAQKSAGLITEPLLEVLNQLPGKLDAITEAVKEQFDGAGSNASVEFASANPAIIELVRVLSTIKETGKFGREEQSSLITALDSLKNFNPEVIAKALGSNVIDLGDGLKGSLGEALSKVSLRGDVDTNRQIQQLDEKAGDSPFLKIVESSGFLEALNKLVEGVNSAANVFSGFIPGFSPDRKAVGGLISGPGGPREDRVPILASPGEFIINAQSAKKIGLSTLHALNSGKQSFGNKFQDGGLVYPPEKRGVLYFNPEGAPVYDRDYQGNLTTGEYGQHPRILFKDSLGKIVYDQADPIYQELRLKGLDKALEGKTSTALPKEQIEEKVRQVKGDQEQSARLKKFESSDELFQNVNSRISSNSSQLSRRIKANLNNILRVQQLNQTKEGRAVLDAELNEESLLKELEFSFKEVAQLQAFANSLTRGKIQLKGPDGELKSFDSGLVDEGYFAPGASINPDTGEIIGQIFSDSVSQDVNRIATIDLERIANEAQSIAVARGKKFEFGVTGGKFAALVETIADSDNIPGAAKAPLGLASGLAASLEKLGVGTKELGYGAGRTTKNLVTGDFAAAGTSALNLGKGILHAPVDVLQSAVDTAGATATGLSQFGQGFVGDGSENFSEAARQFGKAGESGADLLLALEGARGLPGAVRALPGALRALPGTLARTPANLARLAKAAPGAALRVPSRALEIAKATPGAVGGGFKSLGGRFSNAYNFIKNRLPESRVLSQDSAHLAAATELEAASTTSANAVIENNAGQAIGAPAALTDRLSTLFKRKSNAALETVSEKGFFRRAAERTLKTGAAAVAGTAAAGPVGGLLGAAIGAGVPTRVLGLLRKLKIGGAGELELAGTAAREASAAANINTGPGSTPLDFGSSVDDLSNRSFAAAREIAESRRIGLEKAALERQARREAERIADITTSGFVVDPVIDQLVKEAKTPFGSVDNLFDNSTGFDAEAFVNPRSIPPPIPPRLPSRSVAGEFEARTLSQGPKPGLSFAEEQALIARKATNDTARRLIEKSKKERNINSALKELTDAVDVFHDQAFSRLTPAEEQAAIARAKSSNIEQLRRNRNATSGEIQAKDLSNPLIESGPNVQFGSSKEALQSLVDADPSILGHLANPLSSLRKLLGFDNALPFRPDPVSGVINAKKVNTGRFQKSSIGGTFLDRKYKADLKKAISDGVPDSPLNTGPEASAKEITEFLGRRDAVPNALLDVDQHLDFDTSSIAGAGNRQFLKPRAINAFARKGNFKLATATPDIHALDPALQSTKELIGIKSNPADLRSNAKYDLDYEYPSPEGQKALQDFLDASDEVERVTGKKSGHTIEEIQEALRNIKDRGGPGNPGGIPSGPINDYGGISARPPGNLPGQSLESLYEAIPESILDHPYDASFGPAAPPKPVVDPYNAKIKLQNAYRKKVLERTKVEAAAREEARIRNNRATPNFRGNRAVQAASPEEIFSEVDLNKFLDKVKESTESSSPVSPSVPSAPAGKTQPLGVRRRDIGQAGFISGDLLAPQFLQNAAIKLGDFIRGKFKKKPLDLTGITSGEIEAKVLSSPQLPKSNIKVNLKNKKRPLFPGEKRTHARIKDALSDEYDYRHSGQRSDEAYNNYLRNFTSRQALEDPGRTRVGLYDVGAPLQPYRASLENFVSKQRFSTELKPYTRPPSTADVYKNQLKGTRFTKIPNIETLKPEDIRPGHPGFDPERLVWKGGIEEPRYVPPPLIVDPLDQVPFVGPNNFPDSPRWFSGSPSISAGYLKEPNATLRAYDIRNLPEGSSGPFTPHVATDPRKISSDELKNLSDVVSKTGRSGSSDVSASPFYEKTINYGNIPEPIARYKSTSERGLLQFLEGEEILPRANLSVKELHELVERYKKIGRFSSGGKIVGQGTAHSDQVPILASPGEFIMNAASASRIGAPILELMNNTGMLPKFATGGEVGGDSRGMSVSLNTEEIAKAIKDAVTDALKQSSISLDSAKASDDIANAVKSALSNIQLPEVKLDASSLGGVNLGNALGADVRNRLESAEGSIVALREDTNTLLDDTKGVKEEVSLLNNEVSGQKDKILNEVTTILNQEISTLLNDNALDARIDKIVAKSTAEINELRNDVNQARATANRALSQALLRP